MIKRCSGTMILLMILVLVAGCGSSANPTLVPPTQAKTEPSPTATPAAVPTATPVSPPDTPIPATQTTAPAPTEAEPVPPSDTWFKSFGGDRDDVCDDILLADDDGYFLVGATNLRFEPERDGDIYLIRTDAAGDVLWEKVYEKEGYQQGLAAFQTDDGGLLISGATSSPNTNGMDVYMMKLDQDGNELWFKTFGGPLDEMGAAQQMADGSYILVGNIVDPDDFVADPSAAGYGGFEGRSNVYLAKLDADGNELWSHAYGGEDNVLVTGGVQTPDGGGLFLATIMYFPESGDDVLLFKVDENGDEVWSRTWEEGAIGARDLVQTADGNYLITGSYSSGDEIGSNEDILFIKIDSQGNELWRSTFGDPDMIDYGTVLAKTTDGGYVTAGERVADLHTWDADISLVKIDGNGQLLWEQIIETDAHCMFGNILQYADGGYVIAGSIFNGRDFDIFVIKTDAQGNVTATLEPAAAAPTPAPVAGQAINAENVGQLEQVAAFDLPNSVVNTIVFSPDSRTLITGDRNGEVLMWDRETWEKTTYLPARSTRAADSANQVWFWGTLALSPDGNTIVTAYGDDGAVTGRDREGQEMFTFSYGARVYSVAISPDGKFLAVGGMQSNVIVFDLGTRQAVADLPSKNELVTNLVFSPDGKTLLVGYGWPDNTIKTWDIATWQETATFPHVPMPDDCHDILFSPDGQELVIASTEQVEIKFLDLSTLQNVREFSEHTRAPYQIAFSPDGSLLASASDDGTFRLWDMTTGVNIKTIQDFYEAGAVAFSPDGTLIAFSLWGKGVQVWAVAP